MPITKGKCLLWWVVPPNLEILTRLTHVGHLKLNGLYSYYYYFEEAQCGPDLVAR